MSALPFARTRASIHLDTVRAAAALVVVLSHWRMLLFVDYKMLPTGHGLLAKAFYLLTQGGHTAVVVFFVLSGYLISGSIFRSLEKGSFSFPLYVTHRLARLWSVLLPAIILCGMLDLIGIHFSHAYPLYLGAVRNSTTDNAVQHLTLRYAFDSFFFLQRSGDVFGSDVPLWSLAYEFWYYLLFPIALLLWRVRPARQRVVLLCSLVFVAAIAGWQVLLLFPLWLAGVTLHFLPPIQLSARSRYVATTIFCIGFYALTVALHIFTGAVSSMVLMYVVGLVTTLFLWVVLSAREERHYTRYEGVSRFTADFSYSLYAVHFPMLLLFTAFVAGTERWVPTPLHLLTAAVGLMLALIWGWSFSRVFERRAPLLQAWLARACGLSPRSK